MADLCYIGTTADFARRGGDGISQDAQGIKSGVLTYEGDKNYLDNFLTAWPDGESHPDDSGLKKISQQITFRGPVARVIMIFAGDTQGGAGIIINRSYRSKVAILRASASTAPEIDFRVSYYSPSVTLQWTSSTSPATPQKETESELSSGDAVDIWFAEAEPSDAPPVLADPNNLFTLNTDYTTRPFCEQFQIVPLGLGSFLITETWSLAVDSAYSP